MTENELIADWQATKNFRSRDIVIHSHRKFVVSKALKYPQNSSYSLEDLIQVGMIGICTAMNTYVPNTKCKFLSYAAHYVKMETVKFVEKNLYGVNLYGKSRGLRKLLDNLRHVDFSRGVTHAECVRISGTYNIPLTDIIHFTQWRKGVHINFGDDACNFSAAGGVAQEVLEQDLVFKSLQGFNGVELAALRYKFEDRNERGAIAREVRKSPQHLRNVAKEKIKGFTANH